MRALSHLLSFTLSATVLAQVSVDHPVVLTGTDPGERSITGLAPARTDDALIDVDGARSGRYHQATATQNGASLILAMGPACTAYTNGLEVRFTAPGQAMGAVTVDIDGLGARPLLRSDGARPGFGDIEAGQLVGMVYRDSAFVLMGRANDHCPAGFIALNERLCIQGNDTLNMSVFSATSWCMERGARLCTWDEYVYACLKENPQFEGFADDWEWVDDTSDHTHTAFQVGRWGCRSARNFSAYETPASYASVRCCYHVK